MNNLVLEIVEGKEAGKTIPLSGSIDVGREPGLALTIGDEQLSRRHARFAEESGRAAVADLGSTNGTYVNEQPIQGTRQLAPGDRVRVGLTVLELRSADQVAARPSAVRPVPPITKVGHEVLEQVPEAQLPAARAVAPGPPPLRVEEAHAAYVPPDVLGDAEAESDYKALAALVDARVKRRTTIATFASLSIAGLAVLIFFGVR